MAVEKLREKLAKFVSKEPSKWLEQAKWRLENRTSLKRSQEIAMKILDRIEALGISQKNLAELINVSPQHISKIVKGKENLTLETICKLEVALGINLISVNENPVSMEEDYWKNMFSFNAESLVKLNNQLYCNIENIFNEQMLSAYNHGSFISYNKQSEIIAPQANIDVEYTGENNYAMAA